MNEEGKIIAEESFLVGEKAAITAEQIRSFSAESTAEKDRSKSLPQTKQQKGWFWYVSLLFLVVSILVWLWSELINPYKFPISNVQIRGSYEHVDRNLLHTTILPEVHKSFFSFDGLALQDRLMQLPWVYSASVHRLWPDGLQITIIEQQPFATWNETTLVNSQGDLFAVDKATVPSGLPSFQGPNGQQHLMLQMYQQLLPLVSANHLTIETLVLDARQAWQVQLSNHITLLVGRVQPLERLQRFFTIYPQTIAPKADMIEQIDLRYSNGLAVRFKNQNTGTIHG